MEEFLTRIKQDSVMFYFVIIFSVLWLGGMIWGAALIIRSIGKSRQAFRFLKSIHFEDITKRRDRLERVKEICRKTLCRSFAREVETKPRDELLQISTDDKKIKFKYSIPESEYEQLALGTGIKQKIQVVSRELTLSNIVYRYADSEAFFACTNDIKRIRSYRPQTSVRSESGWILCFPLRAGIFDSISIYKKFTGSRGFMMNFAMKIAQVKLPDLEGLLPEFEKDFGISSGNIPESKSILDEKFQRIILRYKDFIPEGIKIFLDKEGIWLTGTIWLNKREMQQMILLCEELKKSALR